MVSKKEILINGRLYEVVSLQEFQNNPDAYLAGYTAVEDGFGYVYPVQNSTSFEPGLRFRQNCPVQFFNVPEGEEDNYSADKVIDYGKAKNIKELIETQDMVKELEKNILTSSDNIFIPAEDPNDSPAMKALKEAVTNKKIDLNKYEPRFGANFNNDKRIFSKENISLPMLVRMCNALDIKATLTLEDKNRDVPNPINKSISVEITTEDSDSTME